MKKKGEEQQEDDDEEQVVGGGGAHEEGLAITLKTWALQPDSNKWPTCIVPGKSAFISRWLCTLISTCSAGCNLLKPRCR